MKINLHLQLSLYYYHIIVLKKPISGIDLHPLTNCIVLYNHGVARIVVIYMRIEVCPFFVANCVVQARMFKIHARYVIVPARNTASNISIGTTWCKYSGFLFSIIEAAYVVIDWLIELRR